MTLLIETIKQLREETHAGVQDCRKALEASNQNYAAALEILRKQAAEEAARRANHVASQGMIELYSHASGRISVMVEENTESDYAGRSDIFRDFTHEIALQIAASAPLYVRDEDIPSIALDEQRQKAAETIDLRSKPEVVRVKILEGYVEKYKNTSVLLRQPYIRDDALTIAQLLEQMIAKIGENIVIRRFQRWELNDSMMHTDDDLANA